MDLLRPTTPPPPGVVLGFTARGGPLGPLDLLGRPADTPDTLATRWSVALTAVSPALSPDRLALARQVHGRHVVVVDRPTGPVGVVGDADGLVTTVPGLALAVRVADCVPVLLAVPGGVAAVHAGWRGVASGIVPHAVAVLCAQAGSSAADVAAWIGPHIAPARFEVGPEVVDAIEASGVARGRFARSGRGDRWLVDLGAALRDQLAAAGVRCVADVGDPDHPERFFSWRGDGPETGRQAGIVAWLGDV